VGRILRFIWDETLLLSIGSGKYSFSGAQNGSYTVTPALIGYTFTPANLPVTVSGANLTGKDFTAATNSSNAPVSIIMLPKTGQTTSYAAGDDGALQKGLA
jgi:hypothetical protein